MFISRHIRFFGKTAAILSVLSLFLIMSIGASAAHAQTRQKLSPAVDTTHCVHMHNVNFTQYCAAPTVTLPNPTHCPGQQYFGATDGYGNPIDWTYTDAGNHCVTVTYNLPFSFSSCDVSFYVPRGNADAFFYYYLNGVQSSSPVDERDNEGWIDLFTIYGSSTLSFYDYQPRDGGAQLGWGSVAYDGVRVFCS